MLERWIIEGASVEGEGRAYNGDCFAVSERIDASGVRYLALAVADGAGSAAFGPEAAAVATSAFVAAFNRATEKTLRLDKLQLNRWRAIARAAVIKARTPGDPLSDHATTFLAIIIGPDRFGAMQIGDGAIVIGDDAGEWRTLFKPQRGRFANETSFLAMSRRSRAAYAFSAATPRAVALFTDGFERLAIDSRNQSVAAPLFAYITERVIAGAPLEPMLRSDAVRARTDDDCTLVMALRALP